MSKLENDCLSVLDYAVKQWPRWVPITELCRSLNIPPSTMRNIFLVCDRGYFVKSGDRGGVFQDVFTKIAQKHRYDYSVKKKRDSDGRTQWHISATKLPYFD